MTWKEANLSLQLAVEERIGTVNRLRVELARGQEDAAYAALAAAKVGVTSG